MIYVQGFKEVLTAVKGMFSGTGKVSQKFSGDDEVICISNN